MKITAAVVREQEQPFSIEELEIEESKAVRFWCVSRVWECATRT
jgi:Zn-dependent alcohol dehydrogenase